jgi:hypothetical membrane protein
MAPRAAGPHLAVARQRPEGRSGAWSWVLATPLFLLAQLVAAAGWTRSYSWASNNISDLGVTSCGPWQGGERWVCSPFHEVMNVGFVATGVLVVLGVVLRWRSDRAVAGPAGACVLIAGAAYTVAGFAPADRHENVHVVLAALPLFVLGNVGLVLAAARHSAWPAMLRWAALLMGLVGLGATVLFFSRHDLGLGMGGMERVVVWPLLVVLLVVGLNDLRRRT